MSVEQGDNGEVGDAENFGFAVRSVRVGNGELLDLPGPGAVTVVVGANNVGKSTFLAQIYDRLWTSSLRGGKSPAVVTEIGEPWIGTVADLTAWLMKTRMSTIALGSPMSPAWALHKCHSPMWSRFAAFHRRAT